MFVCVSKSSHTSTSTASPSNVTHTLSHIPAGEARQRPATRPGMASATRHPTSPPRELPNSTTLCCCCAPPSFFPFPSCSCSVSRRANAPWTASTAAVTNFSKSGSPGGTGLCPWPGKSSTMTLCGWWWWWSMFGCVYIWVHWDAGRPIDQPIWCPICGGPHARTTGSGPGGGGPRGRSRAPCYTRRGGGRAAGAVPPPPPPLLLLVRPVSFGRVVP